MSQEQLLQEIKLLRQSFENAQKQQQKQIDELKQKLKDGDGRFTIIPKPPVVSEPVVTLTDLYHGGINKTDQAIITGGFALDEDSYYISVRYEQLTRKEQEVKLKGETLNEREQHIKDTYEIYLEKIIPRLAAQQPRAILTRESLMQVLAKIGEVSATTPQVPAEVAKEMIIASTVEKQMAEEREAAATEGQQ